MDKICPERGKEMLDAIIGRYRVRMEDTGLVLTHPSGMSFDLTTDETLGLRDFIHVYRKALAALDRETDPAMQRVVIKEAAKEPAQES